MLNLSAFAPLARVVSRRQLAPTIGSLKWHEHATLTFSAAAGGERARPLRLKPAPLPALLAAAQLLGERASCEEGGDGGCAVQHVAYCHTTTCRSRTRRACKRLAGGCARTAQRLPNNYLFEHRLGPLLCAEGSPLLARSPARARPAREDADAVVRAVGDEDLAGARARDAVREPKLALVDARDDLEMMNNETDDAVYYWGNMYCANCDHGCDDDDDDDECCSPEEAQLLLYLGKNLHDYMYNVEAHRDYLVDVSEKFDTGLF